MKNVIWVIMLASWLLTGCVSLTDPRPSDADADIDGDVDSDADEELPCIFYRDSDSDGYGDPGSRIESSCEERIGYVEIDGDCDDTNPDVNPEAEEVCDGEDNDCDDEIDEGCVSVVELGEFQLESFAPDEGGFPGAGMWRDIARSNQAFVYGDVLSDTDSETAIFEGGYGIIYTSDDSMLFSLPNLTISFELFLMELPAGDMSLVSLGCECNPGGFVDRGPFDLILRDGGGLAVFVRNEGGSAGHRRAGMDLIPVEEWITIEVILTGGNLSVVVNRGEPQECPFAVEGSTYGNHPLRIGRTSSCENSTLHFLSNAKMRNFFYHARE